MIFEGDHLKYKQRRKKLGETLKDKGIKDEAILDVFERIPRHLFVDTAFEARAYNDTALPIGEGQTISQPYTVARQTELLEVFPGEKILEIGTGSGYQAAILCELGAKVYSVERQKKLYRKAQEKLKKLGYSVQLKLGDGTLGWSAYAPYDGIVVTAGAPVVPEDLVEQLNINGRLIVPVGGENKQEMVRVRKVCENEFEEEHYRNFKFVPLVGKKGWEED